MCTLDHNVEQAVFVSFVLMAVVVQRQASVRGLSVDWCFEPDATFSYFNANKRDGILFSYLHGKFQVSVARVQFVEENVSFVEFRHDAQCVVRGVAPVKPVSQGLQTFLGIFIMRLFFLYIFHRISFFG